MQKCSYEVNTCTILPCDTECTTVYRVAHTACTKIHYNIQPLLYSMLQPPGSHLASQPAYLLQVGVCLQLAIVQCLVQYYQGILHSQILSLC